MPIILLTIMVYAMLFHVCSCLKMLAKLNKKQVAYPYLTIIYFGWHSRYGHLISSSVLWQHRDRFQSCRHQPPWDNIFFSCNPPGGNLNLQISETVVFKIKMCYTITHYYPILLEKVTTKLFETIDATTTPNNWRPNVLSWTLPTAFRYHLLRSGVIF